VHPLIHEDAAPALRSLTATPAEVPPRFVRGDGVYLYDEAGRAYLDCAAGTFNVSLGHGHPEVVAAMRAQAELLVQGSAAYRSPLVDELRRRLAAVAPPGLGQAHVKACSGSTANEAAIRFAQHVTGRRDVVSLHRSHHGQTALTTCVSGDSRRRAGLEQQFAGTVHVPGPYCLRCFYRQRPQTCGLLCAERVSDFIDYASSGSVACLIVEPILGNGGNIVAPDGYLAVLRRICDERGIVLIFDEVQTGIGRTGRMFAADHYGVVPDVMTLAKGLGGAGVPIAAVLASEDLPRMPADLPAFTGGGNLVGVAAAVKTLEIVGRPGFLAQVQRVGGGILERLRTLQARTPAIGDVRGVGLMIGVEIVGPGGAPDPGLTNRLALAGLDHGLVLRTSSYGRGNVVKVRPPLVIGEEDAETLCHRFEELVEAVC
jgi:4-aminobutyrate aminotransferase